MVCSKKLVVNNSKNKCSNTACTPLLSKYPQEQVDKLNFKVKNLETDKKKTAKINKNNFKKCKRKSKIQSNNQNLILIPSATKMFEIEPKTSKKKSDVKD